MSEQSEPKQYAGAVEEAIDALAPHGIDIKTVLAHGITAEGYNEALIDENGMRVYDEGDEVISQWRTWPNPDLGRRMVKLAARMGHL